MASPAAMARCILLKTKVLNFDAMLIKVLPFLSELIPNLISISLDFFCTS